MSEYLDTEAQVEGEDNEEDDCTEDSLEDNLVIDDDTESNNLSFYSSIDNLLQNVGDVESICQEEISQLRLEAENLEPNNLSYEGEIVEDEVELKNQKMSLKKFKETFYPLNNNNEPQPLT